SSTFRPYSAGEAIGDTSPTLPTAPVPYVKKKKGKCGGMGGIIVMVVAIVATIYTAGVASVGFGAGFGTTMGAGATALGTSGALSFGGLALAGAAGSIAGQLAGNALGVQQGFSWGAVATAGLTSGLLGTGPMQSLTQGIGKVAGNALGNYGAIAARSMVGNVVNQGIGNITGSQKGFSWSSVAISGIGAAVGTATTNRMGLTQFNAQGQVQPVGSTFGDDLGRAVVSAGSFALTQVAVQGGRLNWQQVAADTLTDLIQNRAANNQAAGTKIELSKAQQPGIALDSTNMPWSNIGVLEENISQISFNLASNTSFTGERIDISNLVDIAFDSYKLVTNETIYGLDTERTPGLRATGVVLQDYQNKLAQIEAMDIKQVLDPNKPNQYLIMIHTDGTRNNPEQAIPTNVYELRKLIQQSQNSRVRSIYVSGVGSDIDVGGLNSASGTGVMRQIEEAYLETVYRVNEIYRQNPDAEFVFGSVGFSRGANVARILQNRLVNEGIPLLSSGRTMRTPLMTENGIQYDKYIVAKGQANIGVSVLFDTVDTGMGSLFNQSIPSQSVQGLHLTAINEYRSTFQLTSILNSSGKSPQGWIEMPVYGAHTNIGGGSYDRNGIGAMNLQLAYAYLQKAGVPLAPLPAAKLPNYDSSVIYDSRFIKNSSFINLVNDPAQQRAIKYMH
ncbi:phospholipase effector Tle1 domain-containing protein, partial [Methylobacillus pratensis]